MNPEPADVEAIPPDATTEQVESNDPIALTPRQEMMNQIIEHRENEPDDNSHVPESDTLTVKVDGIEQEIPIDQAKAVIQKNMAADKRLNDAVLKQQHLQQWEQRLLKQEQHLQQHSEQPGDNTEDHSEQLRAAVDALYDGDTDDAVKALSEVIGRNQATPNPDQISQQATQNVMQALAKQKFDAEVMEGNQLFKEEFPDIASDQTLHSMADQKTIELMATHNDWTPTQIIQEAGRQTREWVQNLTGQRSPTRAERKQHLQDMPRSTGSIAYQPPTRNDGPNTPQQVIASMRAGRGQA